MKILRKSYLEFLNAIADYNEKITVDLKQSFGAHLNHFKIPLKQFPVVHIIDFTRKNYLFVHKRCKHITGYSSNYFLEGGIDAYTSKWSELDFDLYNKKIFPENLKFLNKQNPEEISDIIFSHSYTFKKPNGQEAKLLERISFIMDSSGSIPLGAVGSLIDITHFKNDDSIVHTIEVVGKKHNYGLRKLLHKKIYFKDQSLMQLSGRETEILKWIFQGLASKQIADKLHITLNTVNNHRKNMLRKTNCSNIFELIAYTAKNNSI